MSTKLDVQWSQSDPYKFLTWGAEITLHEIVSENETSKRSYMKISDDSYAEVLATNSSHHYVKCVDINPKSVPALVAVGLANGKVSLISFGPQDHLGLAGKEIVPRHARQCTSLEWCKTENALLAIGLDKCRPDNCIKLWDVEHGGTTSEVGLSDSAHSLCWLNQSKSLLAGMSQKYLKLIDARDSLKVVNTVATKAVYGVAVDPQNDKQVASYIDNIIAMWDLRMFDKPVITVSQGKIIIKVQWCPTRSNLLGSVHRDSSMLHLHDIRRTLLNSDDWEPIVLERSVYPASVQDFIGGQPNSSSIAPLSSFCWHPSFENRLLATNTSGAIMDYKVCERIAMTYSKANDLMWSCSRQSIKLLKENDIESKWPFSIDISNVIKRRASLDYGLKHDLESNGPLAEDETLCTAWQWLSLAQSMPLGTAGGVRAALRMDGGYAVIISEVMLTPWPDFPGAPGVKMYRSEERELALQLCGWDSGVLDRLVGQHQYTRAAAVATFQLKVKTASEILVSGAEKTSDSNLYSVAMALGGFTAERSALWRQLCSQSRQHLTDCYLRAAFAFLTCEHDSYDAVLNETGMAVADRVGFACTFLNDNKLSEYLKQLTQKLTDEGDLAGLLLTGTSIEGVTLLQNYLDATGDMQTVSLIAIRTFPNDLLADGQVQDWINSYRELLDSWLMWTQRALFDVALQGRSSTRPSQSIYVSCNFCGKTLSPYMQGARGRAMQRFPGKSKMSSCPNCRKPLPRCAVCLMHMGTASGDSPLRGSVGGIRNTQVTPSKTTEFDAWFAWCQMCRHGGHSKHIVDWFEDHVECPVTSCSCRCFTVDSVGLSKLCIK